MKKLFFYSLLPLSILSTIGCSSDDSKNEDYTLYPRTINTYYDKTEQMTVKSGESSLSASEFTWNTSNDKRGVVNSQGLFSAKKVGSVEVIATKNGKSAKTTVNILPYQNFFKEPLMYFGKTKAEVKAMESRTISNETSTSIGFWGENSSITGVLYNFDSSGKMISAASVFPVTASIIDKVSLFYKERYVITGSSSGHIFMESIDEPLNVTMGVPSSSQIAVVYTKK